MRTPSLLLSSFVLLQLVPSCTLQSVALKETAGPEDTSPDSGEDSDTSDTEDSEPPEPSVVLTAAPAFDPILGGPLVIETTTVGKGDLVVEILDEKGATVASVETSWDGRDTAGNRVAAGPYRIVASLEDGGVTLAQDVEPVRVVRCGFLQAFAEDDGGASSTLVPMFWYRDRVVQDLDEPFVQIDAIDDVDETPVDFPAVTTQLDYFPDDANLPLATTAGSRPLLTLVLSDETILGGSGLSGANVGLKAPGWEVLSGVPLDPAVPVVLQADAAVSDTLGVVEESLALEFTATSADGKTEWSLGSQTLPVRWEVMLGEPTFTHSDPQYTAWAAGVEPALRAIDGTKPEHDVVLNALVEWVYYDLGLAYDTISGACFYTRGDWSNSTFMAGSFLDRAAGSIVNCSDCAGIMAFYANQIGADLNYVIVLQNFSLNQILAIGGSTYSNCPFGSWGCGFSYHAVTTDDGGGTIWDATLALDGDDDPSSLPSELLLVQAIDGDEYLDRLVMSGETWYQYESKGMIQ